MTKKGLKIIIILKLVILLSIIVACILSNSKFSKIKSKISKQERSLKSEVSNYQSKIDSFNAKTRDITEALKTWEQLTEDNPEFHGIKISIAKKILDRLQEKYKFKYFDIKMSKPSTLDSDYKRETIATESSTIKMNIRSYSDIQIMSFIYDMSQLFPGYFKVNSYYIKLEKDISEILIGLSEDEKVSSVYAEIECDWKQLKEL